MNESTRKKVMSAKHPPIHREFCDMRINKKTEMRMRKVILMTKKIERRLGFIGDKKRGGLQQQDYVTTSDNNDLERTLMLSERIRIMGDIPYEQEIEE